MHYGTRFVRLLWYQKRARNRTWFIASKFLVRDSGTSNLDGDCLPWALCLRHTLKKLVPETGTSFCLVPQTSTCVGQFGTSFSGTSFLHAIEHSSIPAQKLSSTWHDPCSMVGWPAICFGARNCDELVSNVSCKFLVLVSVTAFLTVFHRHCCVLNIELGLSIIKAGVIHMDNGSIVHWHLLAICTALRILLVYSRHIDVSSPSYVDGSVTLMGEFSVLLLSLERLNVHLILLHKINFYNCLLYSSGVFIRTMFCTFCIITVTMVFYSNLYFIVNLMPFTASVWSGQPFWTMFYVSIHFCDVIVVCTSFPFVYSLFSVCRIAWFGE